MTEVDHPIPVGTIVQWWDRKTGGRRLGTVTEVARHRGERYSYRVCEGHDGPDALFNASIRSKGVKDFPQDALMPYSRTCWPDA